LRFFSGDLRALIVVVPQEGGCLPRKMSARLVGKSMWPAALLNASGPIKLRMLVFVGAMNKVSAKALAVRVSIPAPDRNIPGIK
jgi:hypothetical protein